MILHTGLGEPTYRLGRAYIHAWVSLHTGLSEPQYTGLKKPTYRLG